MNRKSINVGGTTDSFPFEVTTKTSSNGDTKFSVNPKSVIYKSFNLKDIMIAPSLLDKETSELIKAKEKNTDRHLIKSLGEDLDAIVDSIIYIELEISPNLNIIKAEIKAGPQEHKNAPKEDAPPWKGFPEMIGFEPPLEFDSKGQLKNINVSRSQKYAYIPIAHITSDTTVGKPISIFNSQSQEVISQNLVQILNTNIIIQTFNYDGIPVAYPIPFFGGTYLYYDYTKG